MCLKSCNWQSNRHKRISSVLCSIITRKCWTIMTYLRKTTMESHAEFPVKFWLKKVRGKHESVSLGLEINDIFCLRQSWEYSIPAWKKTIPIDVDHVHDAVVNCLSNGLQIQEIRTDEAHSKECARCFLLYIHTNEGREDVLRILWYKLYCYEFQNKKKYTVCYNSKNFLNIL